MPTADDDQFTPESKGEGAPYEPPAVRTRRRRMIVIGVTGLAVVLGVGSFVITDQLRDDTAVRDVTAISDPQPEPAAGSEQPASEELTPSDTPSVATAVSTSPAALPTAATATAKPDPEVSRKITAARSRAAADGVPLQRALTGKALDAVPDVQVTTSGSPQDPDGTLKVVTARGDLTDYQEMAWVGDKGERVGDARCTQRFRLSNDVKPTTRPTLLVCWRTSAGKSAYTVALSLKSPPSKKASVAAIDKAWAKLG